MPEIEECLADPIEDIHWMQTECAHDEADDKTENGKFDDRPHGRIAQKTVQAVRHVYLPHRFGMSA
jgi:hypothetical protein